jgi:hypothetical protein
MQESVHLQSVRGWFARRGFHPGVVAAYVALIVVFFAAFSQFYMPGKGFSYLIAFGGKQEKSRLTKVRKLDYHVQKLSDGYDAQYYVQIAMDPSLQNRELRHAVDSLPYRARRILMSATAWLFGLGQPAAILQVYAVQNAIAWLLLAALLLHWFPPASWDNLIRWAGVLFSFGACVSVCNALVDGPSLLLIAFGVYLLEKNRGWLATGVFALSGLAKETNVLGAAALLPSDRNPRNWGRAVLRGILVGLPLALWLVYIAMRVGPATDLGYRNFDLPFAAYIRKWREIAETLPEASGANPGPLWSLALMVALTVQFLFLVCRPQWTSAWWRIGASFAALMVVLGDAVWEGYPGAASRVLLPMQLAFNVLVPAGRGWRALLLLGNVTLLTAPTALQPPAGAGYLLKGERSLLIAPGGEMVSVELDDGWYPAERGGANFWTWTSGDSSAVVTNPHPYAIEARLRFTITAPDSRSVRVVYNGEQLWESSLTRNASALVTLSKVRLAPGENRLEFETDASAGLIGSDPRPLAFAVYNLRLDLQRRADPE